MRVGRLLPYRRDATPVLEAYRRAGDDSDSAVGENVCAG